MLPTEDLFVYVYVLIDDAIKARAIVIPARPGPAPAAPTRRSWRSPRCACCWAAAARPGSSPRWPATGRTCSRYCRTKASSTGGPAGCGARSSSSARRWRPACPKTTASRSTPARCRSSTPPGPRPRRLDRPQWPACPVRPRRRARRVVLRLPPGGQDRPGQPHRAGLEHRARRRQRA